MSGPSDKAMVAATEMATKVRESGRRWSPTIKALEAAHNPALGPDRSVCLRDVSERLREKARTAGTCNSALVQAADFIESEFGNG